MEESHASAMATPSVKSNVSVMDLSEEPDCQSGSSRMKADDLARKVGEPSWDVGSPEGTPSLLPPFGPIQPAHLPTPLSPGDLVNYLSAPGKSPLSVEHPRPGHNRYQSSQHSRSRSTSAQPPKTPQRSRPPSAFNRPPLLSAHQGSGDTSRPEEMKSERPAPSQVATPSPEISRTRRTLLKTPSDSETMFATPQPQRSSQLYTESTPLAPAPIISPANSSHSTTSPEYRHDNSTQSSLTSDLTYDLASLVSKHQQTPANDQGNYDIDDPFIVPAGQGHRDVPSRKRYPSPPPPSQFYTTDTPVQIANSKENSLENSISEHDPPSIECSAPLSQASPVKAEADDEHYNISVEPLIPSHNPLSDRGPPSQPPISPRTPPRTGSGRAFASDPQASTLEDSAFQTPPPSGGEIERIRQRHAVIEETRLAESEKRRPDYLLRIKRARDIADEEAAESERDNALSGLGVVISPYRGRRLKLYQPVAVPANVVLEEAAEREEAPEPKTPPPISTAPTGSISSRQGMIPSMSMRAIDWHTPKRDRSSPVDWTEEDELRKQKRLQAFAAPQPSGKGCRLKPAEVLGQGRVIIDVTSDESRRLAEDGVLQLLDTPDMDSVEHAALSLATGHGAEWPDKEYPWSVQERQRDEYEAAWRRQRLAWIERFLDRESESEEEENDCVPGPSTWTQTFDIRPERGLGRSISMNAAPNSKRSGSLCRVKFSAAHTDAREVLLSKRHVRAVAERLQKRRMAEEEEGVVMCICQGADDGRPMVRCDECRTWYHLICMDIHDVSELGDEWYCFKCLPSAEDPPPLPSTEPTFAPAMPESPPRAGVGDQPLYQSALQPSPMPASPITQRKGDRSPTRPSRLLHSIGDPGDPVRGGPSTPYHSRSADSRLYSTYDEYGTDDHAPFDPTSTPSRGLKFPNPVPITPRRPHPWTPFPTLSWTTPSGLPRTPQFSAPGGSSNRSLAYSFSTLEDTVGPLTSPWPPDSPTRKSHKGADSAWPYPTSPLAVRGTDQRPFLPGIEDSPTLRHSHKGKDSSELTSRVDRSPRRE